MNQFFKPALLATIIALSFNTFADTAKTLTTNDLPLKNTTINLSEATPLVSAASSAMPAIGDKKDEITKIKQASQISKHFTAIPNPKDSAGSQYLANFAKFTAIQGQGTLAVESTTAETVVLEINGAQFTLNKDKLNQPLALKELVPTAIRSGVNILHVAKIIPESAEIQLDIPYPVLVEKDPKAIGFSSQKLAQLDKYIKDEVDKGFPGAVLIVVKDNQIIKQTAYGYQRKFDDHGALLPKDQLQPMKVDTLFDLASNTKMFATNYAIMQLVSEGKLDIDKPIHDYIPEYKGDGREEITPRDILTHSAGYAPEVKFFDPKNALGEAFYSQQADLTKSLILTKVPFIYPHGTKSVYSDTDYMLAGILVERISGQPLDQYVQQHIYQPLALTQTTFNPLQHGFKPEQIAATEIQGNTRQGTITFPNIRTTVLQGQVHDEKAFYSMGGVSGHAGLFSTAKDLATLASVMLNRGGYAGVQLFSPQVIDQFTKPSDRDLTFGIGWRRAGNGDLSYAFGQFASPYAFGHTGWTGIDTVIDPAYNLVIILLTNKKQSQMASATTFKGDLFSVGQYGAVINQVYEAMLTK